MGHVCVCSVVSDSAIPWTVTYRVPLSMEFSKQEYWSGFSFPTLGDLPDPGTKPMSLESPALDGRFITVPPGKPNIWSSQMINRLFFCFFVCLFI